jgi:hypothetical protein
MHDLAAPSDRGSGIPRRLRVRIGDIEAKESVDAPGEKHWHGASAATAMTHTAIQEQLDGKAVDWLEQVSDEQYRD